MFRGGKLRREVVPLGFGEAQLRLSIPAGLDMECRNCVLMEEAHLHGSTLFEAGCALF